MRNLALICVLAAGSITFAWALSADAHEREGVLQVSTGVISLPALVSGTTGHDLAPAAMAAIAGEYNVHDDIALRVSAGYAYGLTGTNAGVATVQDRSGRFTVVQDAVPLFAGVRFDSRTWLLPLTMSLIAEGGALVVMQSARTLSAGSLSYGLPLGPHTVAAGAVNLTLGASLRVTDQVRIGLDPSLLLLAWNGLHVGFTVALSFAFMRFM